MRINHGCEECLYNRQKEASKRIPDNLTGEAFLRETRTALETRKPDDSSPVLAARMLEIQVKYGLTPDTYPKARYNRMILDSEQEIEAEIERADDPLAMSLAFARAGNYIDFGGTNRVEDDVLRQLLMETDKQTFPEDIYRLFCSRCEQGSRFLLLCDNCGEIVLDKLFIRQLKKKYPQLEVYAMVRGGEVSNDATMEDALDSGLAEEAIIITNGHPIAGTVYAMLGEEERKLFDSADVILSKGQGNYESLFGIEREVFYAFLCKCPLFVQRFQVPRLTGMLICENGQDSWMLRHAD